MSYVKVLDKSAVFAWSPASFPQSYLAAGTNAQQVDSSFSTTSAIDLCRLDFTANDAFQPSLRPSASGSAEFRFHQLVWAEVGGKLGTVIGGCENGAVVLYDPAIKLENPNDQSKSWCIKQSRKHTGSVRSMDINPFQKQLIASGASNGDVFIFDLNNIDQPMTPGPRPSSESQQSVVSVGWNGRVEHILATLFPSYAYVWDLRRSDGPIMKLGDLGRSQWTALKWHPDSSTTFCLASGDDHFPVVQMWDVRFANAACAQLEGHQRGILSMDWCNKDADLLVTCGKDMKTYIWNPNSNQCLAEVPSSSVGAGLGHSWPFEVQWSKRDPNLIAVASFDGRIGIYSLSGAVAGSVDMNLGLSATPNAVTPKLAESFPGADFAFQPATVQKMLQDRQQHLHNIPRVILPSPPKWMRTSCGARFGFGGKLFSFTKPEASQDAAETASYLVDVFQVITEPYIFEKAAELHTALNGDGSSLNLPLIADLCGRRALQTPEETEKIVWDCLQAQVQRQGRERYIEIIGSVDIQGLAEKMKHMCNISLSRSEDSEVVVNGTASGQDHTGSLADYQEDDLEDEADTPSPWPHPAEDVGRLELPANPNSREGLLCQLISSGKVSTAVELCITENRWVEALQLSALGSRRLYDLTQRRYYEQLKDPLSKFICLLTNERWDILVSSVSMRNPDNWRQVFSILMKFVQANDLPECLDHLGRNMEAAGGNCRTLASVCYIVAGWVEQLVENLSHKDANSQLTAKQLHDVVEKATILRVSLGGGSQRALEVGPQLAERLGRYANLLVEQGCLTLALQLLDALPEDTDQHLMELRHRVYNACSGFVPANVRRPKVPYATPKAAAAPYQQQQPVQPSARSRSGSYAPQQHLPPSQLYGNTANVSPQVYNQPPPTTAAPAQQNQAAVSAMKTSRNRYPSYSNSDGISYPTSSMMTSGVPSAYPSASPSMYAAPAMPQQQQYPNYAASPPLYQQQQPPPAPPPVQQMATYRPQAVASHGGHAASHNLQASHHPRLPPPPAGPATELNHRPWNDPPPLSPKKKNAPGKAETPAPVSFPVLGSGDVSSAMGQIPQQFPPPQQQQSMGYQYQQQQPTAYSQPVYQQAQSNQTSRAQTPAPVVVPAEHEKIVNVLSRLAELAAAQAPNVQTRRRIEDGSQKLNNSLPSLLATGRLSKTTLAELHQLVDYIRAYDYASALALHHHIVEGADFSTIASFMPSVKVLIQSASQMGVYYS